MRLLRARGKGRISITQDFAEDEICRYAILSHRWLRPLDEPTFDDLRHGRGEEKLGYVKLLFCAEQVQRHGLEYFWVDTCCIDKSNKAELSRSIRSMFRWYQNAAVCYVYLADVPDELFSESSWFTRGWTLQELLAPRTVLFYGKDGQCLGDKDSLQQQIHDITNIPNSALRGKSLHSFTENERFQWIETRRTELEEDKVYSLFGILDVDLPPLYGEGFAQALERLRDELKKRERCVRDLCVTDARHDKKRIEETKGGILTSCYQWILDHPQFVQWRSDTHHHLLWIRGDPGKGKTMLLCGIIDELETSISNCSHLSYFFCQAGDARINNATSVLRGLISMLVEQQPALISHTLAQYDRHGKILFENANAWVALSGIFWKMVQDPSLKLTYFVVDALDECITDRSNLVKLIHQTNGTSSSVKWIISSRNLPGIEEQLAEIGNNATLSLEWNADAVSEAVRVFIANRVDQLMIQKKYDDRIRNTVERYLSSNAGATFLWVALVCQQLSRVQRRSTLAKLNEFPPGLDALYKRMWESIQTSEDAGLCRQILATMAVIFRPATLEELTSIAEPLKPFSSDPVEVHEIIAFCGSFLTVRESTVYFVHQSAKDFLLQDVSDELLPNGVGAIHQNIFSTSLRTLSALLERDMYELRAPGYAIENVRRPDPDPLARLRYPSSYLIHHLGAFLSDCAVDCAANSHTALVAVEEFLKCKFLYWMECLSLCGGVSDGVLSMTQLQALLEELNCSSTLLELVRDGCRFIRYHKQAIESYPLQVYFSALLFSPQQSVVRRHFLKEEPNWIAIKPGVAETWSACPQTLEGHTDPVTSVVFSADSSRLALASWDDIVKI